MGLGLGTPPGESITMKKEHAAVMMDGSKFHGLRQQLGERLI